MCLQAQKSGDWVSGWSPHSALALQLLRWTLLTKQGEEMSLYYIITVIILHWQSTLAFHKANEKEEGFIMILHTYFIRKSYYAAPQLVPFPEVTHSHAGGPGTFLVAFSSLCSQRGSAWYAAPQLPPHQRGTEMLGPSSREAPQCPTTGREMTFSTGKERGNFPSHFGYLCTFDWKPEFSNESKQCSWKVSNNCKLCFQWNPSIDSFLYILL